MILQALNLVWIKSFSVNGIYVPLIISDIWKERYYFVMANDNLLALSEKRVFYLSSISHGEGVGLQEH